MKRTQFPEGFGVTNEMVEYARERGWADPRKEFDAFKVYHLAHGSVMMDWRMALMTWCYKAATQTPSKRMTPLPTKQLHMELKRPEGTRHDPRVHALLNDLVSKLAKKV